jgi:hypothetical protein
VLGPYNTSKTTNSFPEASSSFSSCANSGVSAGYFGVDVPTTSLAAGGPWWRPASRIASAVELASHLGGGWWSQVAGSKQRAGWSPWLEHRCSWVGMLPPPTAPCMPAGSCGGGTAAAACCCVYMYTAGCWRGRGAAAAARRRDRLPTHDCWMLKGEGSCCGCQKEGSAPYAWRRLQEFSCMHEQRRIMWRLVNRFRYQMKKMQLSNKKCCQYDTTALAKSKWAIIDEPNGTTVRT